MSQKNKKTKRILIRILLWALVGIFCGLCVYNINAKFLLKEALPMPFGIGMSVVISGSMEPELSVNDLIIIKKTDRFYEKQVVVYQSGRSLTVHRIDSINGDEIITKGDANNTQDDPITKDMIKGEVVLAIPLVGAVIGLIQQPIVAVLLLALAFWLMERSFRREKAQEQTELDEIKKAIEELKK